MKIHHLNCGSFCPLSHPLLNRAVPELDRFNLVCHCLLIESDQGLILVDTGLGLQDVRAHSRMAINFSFNRIAKPKLDLEETAFIQISKLGFNPLDVKHIIVTHFDADHIGGLADFPLAKVHVLKDEWLAAQTPKSAREKARYRQIRCDQNKDVKVYETRGDLWHGFKRVQNLEGIDPSIYLVSLPGHTRGHAGVYIEQENPLFFAGDAFMLQTQLKNGKSPLALELYNRLAHEDLQLAKETLLKLQDIDQQEPQISVFCSHDRGQFLNLAKGKR